MSKYILPDNFDYSEWKAPLVAVLEDEKLNLEIQVNALTNEITAYGAAVETEITIASLAYDGFTTALYNYLDGLHITNIDLDKMQAYMVNGNIVVFTITAIEAGVTWLTEADRFNNLFPVPVTFFVVLPVE